MKETPTDDPLFGKGTIRADGRKIHPMYLFEVKKPAESKGPWDYYKIARDHPGRPGLPAPRPGRLPAGEEVETRPSPCPLPGGERVVDSPLPVAGRGQGEGIDSPMIFGIPPQALFGQLLIGLINGSFYALLSLGLVRHLRPAQHHQLHPRRPVHDGRLRRLLPPAVRGLGYWWALLLAPGGGRAASGIVLERTMLKRLYDLDHLYGLLLTFGLALIIQGLFRNSFGSSGLPYAMPAQLAGGRNLGFMFLPNYRAWVIVFSLASASATWYVIERTKLGSYLRAATENPALVQAFGINVPRMITLTYGFGVALAALAGVLAAPIYQVNPLMGADLIIVVFAVVVIGGMGSIMGSIVTGFGLGVVEGLTKVFYPEASNTVIFVIMALVLLVKPAGLFGRAQ